PSLHLYYLNVDAPPDHLRLHSYPTRRSSDLADAEPESLRETIQRFKGRTARETNRVLSRSGPLWQRDWFDRWMRNDTEVARTAGDRKSTRLNSSHVKISYAVFCLKKKNN